MVPVQDGQAPNASNVLVEAPIEEPNQKTKKKEKEIPIATHMIHEDTLEITDLLGQTHNFKIPFLVDAATPPGYDFAQLCGEERKLYRALTSWDTQVKPKTERAQKGPATFMTK